MNVSMIIISAAVVAITGIVVGLGLGVFGEKFKVEIDVTSIDQASHSVEIHQPDGRNDVLQQIEHGALTVVSGYKALGRLYRGIICHTLRQYALLGDASAMTDGIKGNEDDRWVFTEDNPQREISSAAALAATARTLRGFNDTLSVQSLAIAEEVFDKYKDTPRLMGGCLQAAVELYFTTKADKYFSFVIEFKQMVSLIIFIET